MSAADFVIVVLAAGKGTRLKSGLAKVLHRAGGRTLVEHVVRAAHVARPTNILVVVGYQAEDVAAVVTPFGARTVVQEPQKGTGHAMQVARAAIGRHARYALVVPGDAPLLRSATLDALARAHAASGAAATILSAMLQDPSGYGRIVRKHDGSVAAIVEEKAATAEQRLIREVNSSTYAFTLEKLWPCLEALRPENVHRELYLTDAIAVLDQRGEKVIAELAADPQEIFGCNTRAELAEVDRVFRERKRAALMDAGVTFQLPESVLVDPDVAVGHDTVIEASVQLLGATRIGANCVIRTGSVITDSVLEDGVVVRQHCVVASSRLGKGAVVGPFAHLRDGAELRPGARVGNYVEVKKSVLHEGVKAMHLTYLGDAEVGRDTNVGAGTITCNYDGVRKNPTKIGKRVFVGSGTELIAPVEVGDGAYIAAGSTITESVPRNALAIARDRQVTKPGWATQRRKQMAAANPAAGKKAKSPKVKKSKRRGRVPSVRRKPRKGRRK
jgi:bifunctional UDP-N-acetylglucosamine pyrophosphorylase/glucosamine-1-phosphate N-acetyltransferase